MPENLMDFKVDKSGKTDTRKIQELLKKCKVSILVGFPSGRSHIQAVHNEDEDGKRSGGAKVSKQNGKTLETSELAKQLHYGSQSTPARPFLEDAIRENKDVIKEALAKELKKQINGNGGNWHKIGTMAVGIVQEFVRGDYYKTRIPNAQSTIDYKGSDTPLIDGADLINSMSYIVEDKQ